MINPQTITHESLIEDVIDIAKKLHVRERAVLSLIMLGFSQVQIARFLAIRKNTVSTIKIRARAQTLKQYYGDEQETRTK